MRLRGWGWVLLAATTGVGCDSGVSANDESGHRGGQTGSLRPCSTPAENPELSVPTGDAALVFHTGCSSEGELAIRDESGAPVTFELEEIDDGVVLLRTDAALPPGAYTVETPAGTEALTVTEPQPLPMRLGRLTRVGSGCSRLFELEFDPAIMPYHALLKLSYSLDDGPETNWFEYGTVSNFQTSALLEVPVVASGDHLLEVSASIAGESAGPDPISHAFAFDCPASSDQGSGWPATCALRRGVGKAAESAFSGAPGLLMITAWVLWRRRRSMP